MTSEIKVNNIKKASGSTITIGESGDTITLASGASQSGFGRSGSVDWQTGSIKTSTFTASNGEGYFADTTSSAFTMNLPSSPSAGSIVAVRDYAQTFNSNNLTIGRGGSNIEGFADDITIDGKAETVTLVYVDSTKGWVLVGESTTLYGGKFISATGGTVSTVCTNFKVHTFTSPGNFVVSCGGNSGGSNTVDYLVVAGGGGGGAAYAGGGGAGGYRFSNGTASGCYTAGPSPLGASALPVSATTYPIVIGAGGTASTGAGSPGAMERGGNGGNSSFSTITSTGGGGGGSHMPSPSGKNSGNTGGSGGGGGSLDPGAGAGPGGAGNTPPVSPSQGNNGGSGYHDAAVYANGGGGGGASAGGGSIPTSAPTFTNPHIGAGGAGLASSITGSSVTRGGGGGGGAHPARTPGAPGGTGGGGAGGNTAGGTNGTTNTGGGAGGGGCNGPSSNGGVGGSGIVIIRYKFQ
jgi:hypothetical protein|tara:strand:- start:1023 stop:2414 length:1392 start_codon:yes stop_codon:yes gene_type:complete